GDALAIGWVQFHDGAPRPELHLSYANVVEGLTRARAPPAAILGIRMVDEMLVATALGRALAHELGHYFLGSAVHGTGVMQADWTPADLYGLERPIFHLTAADRQRVVSRISEGQMLATR